MGAIENVVRRGWTFHFWRRVPKDLRGRLKRRELVRSLGTSDIRAAKLMATALRIASEDLFGAVRAKPMLTDTQLVRLVQDFYATILERETEIRLRARPHDDFVSEARSTYDAELAIKTRKALAGNRLDEARVVTEAMLKRQGVACSELAPDDWQRARQAVMRAGIDVAEALQARYGGDFNYEPKDKLLRQALTSLQADQGDSASAVPTSAERTGEKAVTAPLGEAAPVLSTGTEAFLADQIASGAWERQSAAQARATFVCSSRFVVTGL